MKTKMKRIDRAYCIKASENNPNADHWLRQQIVKLIHHHQECIELFDSQKEVIKRLMLVVFTTLIINTNVIGSWMAIAIKSGSTCTETLVRALFGSVIFLCFFVYPSQQMSVDCCLDVFCYQTYNWYAYSPKTRSLLLIIMMRASKPMILSAGASNFPMDLRNAGTIMSKITSYIMALLSLYE